MATVHYDPDMSDDERRERLYQGDLFVYSPSPASLKLVELARSMLTEAFAPHDPENAQFHLPVEKYAQLLAELKPRFIHHPENKKLLPEMLEAIGCSAEDTFFDVPRLRTATSDDYLSTGIAYAFHPHRDTWYSAPVCQINFWLPVYPLSRDNCMAFHPRYWTDPVSNSSSIYNYQEWTRQSRFSAAKQIGKDERPQPKALETVELTPDVRLLPPVGGLIVFSAAQLHSTVPNTSGRTRVSIDFRIVNAKDAAKVRGAPNVDSRCTGSTMADYLRCSDLSHLPDDVMALYENGPPPVVSPAERGAASPAKRP
jgi:hypothetical protein